MGETTVALLELRYPVLSDVQREYIGRYGVLHPKEGIARPSLFVIDREGMIRWKYVGANAADRPTTAEVLAELRDAR